MEIKVSETNLKELRRALLALHKLLLDAQVVRYEKKHGRIKEGRAMFYIVSTENSFAWLRQLTELIVGIDGIIDSSVTSTKNLQSLLSYTKKLLTPLKTGTKFSKEYHRAIQDNPEVLICHHQITQILTKKKS